MKGAGLSVLMLFIGIAGSFSYCRFQPSDPGPEGFAVVELFTSEGCSSCPPADAAVGRLLHNNPQKVYVLGFHVDYWNRLGWRDSFSMHEASERQSWYASKFGLNSVYTPQVVVNGNRQFVGSNEKVLETVVSENLHKPASHSLELSARWEPHSVRVDFSTDETEGELNLAIVERHAVTAVAGGENGGRTLEHVNIVRTFRMVTLKKEGKGVCELDLPPGLTSENSDVIGFVQDKAALVQCAAKAGSRE